MPSQAIFDISLTIASIRNITTDWTPRFTFSICFQIPGCENYPCPYLITEQKHNWKSSFDLRSYLSDSVLFSPRQEKVVAEACVFRASLPIERIQDAELLCFVEFWINDESLGTAKFQYDTCIGVCSYLPIFSPGLGTTISAKVETQLLGIRGHKNFAEDSTPTLHKALQTLFHQNNRLTHRLKLLQALKQQNKTEHSISNIQAHQQPQSEKQQLNSLWLEYMKLKEFKPSRIFRSKLVKEHREELIRFIDRAKGEYAKKLQFDWQRFLQLSIADCVRHVKELRGQFIENFALEIKNKVMRNKGLAEKTICPIAIGQLKAKIEGFGLLEPIQNLQQSKRKNSQEFNYLQRNGSHLIVLVHGLGANSYAMGSIERTIRYLYPHAEVLNSRANEEEGEADIERMGRNLAVEVEEAVKQMLDPEELQISFIGHSLGGVVIRSALAHLDIFKQNMNSFISLATPHLGHVVHSNKLTKWGMSLLNSFQKSSVIDGLLLKDAKEERLSYLYSLSTHSGLSWFKSVALYGSQDDGYVSAGSALVQAKGEGFVDSTNEVFTEMARNLNEYIKCTQFNKYMVKFTLEPQDKQAWSQYLLGRSSHIAFPSHQPFINTVLLNNYRNFKQKVPLLLEEQN